MGTMPSAGLTTARATITEFLLAAPSRIQVPLGMSSVTSVSTRSTRFCVDYRKVNAVTRKDAYPLPRIDDTLVTLSGSR